MARSVVRSARPFVLCAAAALAALAVLADPSPTSALAGKDDAAQVKEKRDAFRKKQKDEGRLPTFDLGYYYDSKAAKETRWTQTDPPPVQDAKEDRGMQFYATWTPKEGTPALIVAKIIKFPPAEETVNGQKTGNSMSFQYAGYSASSGDKNKLLQGFWEDWVKMSTDVLKDETFEPKKASGAGPADKLAVATATDKESKKRERREYYVWSSGGRVWLAMFEFPDYEKVKSAKLPEKSVEFLKFFKEADPPK